MKLDDSFHVVMPNVAHTTGTSIFLVLRRACVHTNCVLESGRRRHSMIMRYFWTRWSQAGV